MPAGAQILYLAMRSGIIPCSAQGSRNKGYEMKSTEQFACTLYLI